MNVSKSAGQQIPEGLRGLIDQLTETLIRSGRSFSVVSACVYAALTIAMFSGLWFNSAGEVFSKTGLDLTTQVVPWMHFGFGEISRGNFPLWNPHNFCGTPFFSDFTAGLLYPVHWLNLLLPVNVALNVIVSFHFWLAGWLTSLWCRARGVSAVGSVIGGVIFMYSGAYFHHLYPGHECPIATVAWIPLVLLCIDKIFSESAWKWSLLGMFAVGMQILSCFAQAIYLTALMAGLYTLLRLIKFPRKREAALLCAMMYVGGVAIGMVQLAPGLAASRESIRQGGVRFEFASIGAMPPENFALLLAPNLFGDDDHPPYFGRTYAWEVSLFCGITTLILAGYGAVRGAPERRRFSVVLLIGSSILAMGKHVFPVYWLLFHCVPLFSSFRVTARFNWFMTLYLAMLAGIGFDVIVSARPWRKRPVLITLVAASGLLAMGFVCMESGRAGTGGMWGGLLHCLSSDPEQSNGKPLFEDATFIASSAAHAGLQLWLSALTLGVFATALWLLRLSPRFQYLLAGVTIVELFLFAHSINVRGPLYPSYPPQWRQMVQADDPEYRVLHPTLEFPNIAMVDGFDDVYGYDPMTLKRYSDLIAMTQGLDPDSLNFITQIAGIPNPKLYEMLRCHYMFYSTEGLDPQGNPMRFAHSVRVADPMRRLQLIRRYELQPGRSEVFAAMNRKDFDPRETVILESAPSPVPATESGSGSPGYASVVASSTDWLDIRAHLREPAILLVTDSYSKSWRARALKPGPQQKYTVMPANYALRGIPLAAGDHYFRLEYVPVAFYIGKWVSIGSVIAWLAAAWFVHRMTVWAPKKRQSSGTRSNTG